MTSRLVLARRVTRMRKTRLAGAAILASLALVAAACGSSSKGGSASKTPITIGFVGDLTGPGSSSFGDGYDGAMARIEALNAAGGINGHPINLIKEDTTSTPAGAATAVQLLVSDHVFGIVADSTQFVGGAKYAQQAGIPVTGYGIDAPEWFQQPYTNMFDAFDSPLGPINGKTYGYNYQAHVLQQLGVTKYGVIANATASAASNAKTSAFTAKQLGISSCYVNTSLPFGAVDFTSVVLQIQSAGCDGISTLLPDGPDIALAQAIKNAGLQSKVKVLLSQGYDNNVLNQPSARASVEGDYFASRLDFTPPNAATQQMLNNLEKYDANFHGGIPDLGLYGGYISADLMIYGLQHAGSNPTQASFISKLRTVTTYNAEGILPNNLVFSNFGTPQQLPATECTHLVQLQASGFVSLLGGKDICGTLVEITG